MMRILLLFIALLCAVTLSSSLTPSVSKAANAAKKERAVVKFDQPVQLMGVTLKGEYLFVHNDELMAQGKACTFVYKGQAENVKNLIISFHCTPAERDRAAYFIVRTLLTSPGQYEVREFQFAGSTESHLAPSGQHAGHVTIAN
jgi:hypothetical protein